MCVGGGGGGRGGKGRVSGMAEFGGSIHLLKM